MENLEKLFQTKLAEAEEKYKYTIQILTEENICLRYQCRCSGEGIQARVRSRQVRDSCPTPQS